MTAFTPRFYGRRQSRLSPLKRAVLKDMLGQYRLPLPVPDMAIPYVLEIGFGDGTHLLYQARKHPEVQFIGVEPFGNGVAHTVQVLQAENIGNVWLHPDDVRQLLPQLPRQQCRAIYILFPDPWPKARHNKRRLINSAFMQKISMLLIPGGHVYMASDDQDYVTQMLEVMQANQDFVWQAGCAADWRTPFDPAVTTKYQAKALDAGRKPAFLDSKRV